MSGKAQQRRREQQDNESESWNRGAGELRRCVN